MGRREKKRELTRRQMLEAAQNLFLSKGFEDTSVDEIAEAADVAKGTFYYHFKSKSDVLLAMSLEYLKDLSEYVDEQLGSGRSPLAVLREILHQMAKETQANRKLAKIYYSSVFAQFSRQLEEEHIDNPDVLPNIVIRIVQAAQNCGELRADKDAVDLGLIIAGLHHHAQVSWMAMDEERELAQKVDDWLDISLHGMGAA